MKIRMLFARGIRWVALRDVEQLLERMALNEMNPKYRTKLFEVRDKVKRL